MKQRLKQAVNACIQPLGFEIRRIEEPRLFPKLYAGVIRETIACFEALGFSHWPEDSRRVGLLAELMGTSVSQGIYLVEFLRRSLDLPGDVCEFGVAAGAASALLANEMRATDKTLWLFDSFQGLSKPTGKDILLDDIHGLGSMDRYEGAMAFPVTRVQERLAAIAFPASRVQVVPGFIEDTRDTGPLPNLVAFSFVDFDLYEPIRIALEILDTRLAPGGCVVVDDYGFLSQGAQTAVDEFLAARHGHYRITHPHAFAGCFIVLEKAGGRSNP